MIKNNIKFNIESSGLLKRVIYGLFIAVFLCNCSEAQSDQQIPNVNSPQNYEGFHILRILTYNIFHGEGTNGKIDMDLFADIIKQQKPDLVALQEVDKYVKRSGKIDIVEELAKRTGLQGFFGKYRDYGGGEFGDAILSGFPVVDFTVTPAFSTPKGVKRSYSIAKVQISKDRFIYFSSVHLTHNIIEERFAQTGELLDYYTDTLGESPMIIAGDLNATPDSDEMKVLFEHFTAADKDLNNTFSTRSRLKNKIDYILYPQNKNWKVFEVRPICRNDASDHCAVFAVLGFKKQR